MILKMMDSRTDRLYSRDKAQEKKKWIAHSLNTEERKILSKIVQLADQVTRPLHQVCSNHTSVDMLKTRTIFDSTSNGMTIIQPELLKQKSPRYLCQVSDEQVQHELSDALLLAMYMNSRESADLLLAHGAGVRTRTGQYPLLLAAIDTNNFPMFEAILRHNVDLCEHSLSRMGSPLHAVCRTGNSEILEKLLSLNILDIDSRGFVGGYTPLQTAVQHGHEELVKRLLIAGAKVDAMSTNDDDFITRSALHQAALRGDVTILRHLLEHGARRTITDSKGTTPLELAAGLNHKLCMELLIEGIDLNQPRTDGLTSMYYCCQKGYNRCLDFLLQKGADPMLTSGENNFTPLMEAVSKNHELCVRAFAEHPAARTLVNHISRSDEDQTALSVALLYRYKNLYRILLDMGADTNIKLQAGDQRAPLVLSVCEDSELLQLLLKYGANPNVADDGGECLLSSLMHFPPSKTENSLGILFKYNIDIRKATMKDRNGHFALQKALHMENILAVNSFIKAGCDVTCMRNWACSPEAVALVKKVPDFGPVIHYIRMHSCYPMSLQEASRLAVLNQLPLDYEVTHFDMFDIPVILKEYLNPSFFRKMKSHEIDHC